MKVINFIKEEIKSVAEGMRRFSFGPNLGDSVKVGTEAQLNSRLGMLGIQDQLGKEFKSFADDRLSGVSKAILNQASCNSTEKIVKGFLETLYPKFVVYDIMKGTILPRVLDKRGYTDEEISKTKQEQDK